MEYLYYFKKKKNKICLNFTKKKKKSDIKYHKRLKVPKIGDFLEENVEYFFEKSKKVWYLNLAPRVRPIGGPDITQNSPKIF